MIAEMNSTREKPSAPTPPLFDFNAENSGRQEITDDQETLLAEPIIRQRLDASENVEKPEWAKDLVKSMA